MSARKQKQLAEEKVVVDRQTQAIKQKFRMNRINKAFGQLSGEELLKPITKRLESAAAVVEEENTDNAAENPDYTMDEFDRTNPFGEKFMLDVPTPPPSPEPSPPPPPPYQEFEADGDLQPLMAEKSARKEWGEPGPVVPEYPHESNLLRTVNKLITEHGDDSGYSVGKKSSPLYGISLADLKKKIRDGIFEKRRATQPLSRQMHDGKQRLKPTPPRKSIKIPPTSLEIEVLSRRPVVEPEPSADEEGFPKQDWETEGSGVAGSLVDRLYES